MKRDMTLIIAMMEHLEAQERPNFDRLRELPGWEGIDQHLLSYHAWLLIDAGLANGHVVNFAGQHFEVPIGDLTWNGHDFLAASRNDGAWAKAKKRFGDTLSDVPFAILHGFLIATIKESLGI